MELSAIPDKPTLKPGKCKKCGKEAKFSSIPVYDAPGDCAPIVDHYEYQVWCERDFMATLKFNDPDIAIRVWNEFME